MKKIKLLRCIAVFVLLLLVFVSVATAAEELSLSKDEINFLLEKAENGDAKAQFWIGLFCVKGENFKQDYEQALYWFGEAAEQGNVDAQISLGHMYREGLGTKKDDEKSFYWFKKAAEQGNEKAQLNVGLMFAAGKGVPEDYEQAEYWLNKSAEQDNEDAKEFLEKIRAEKAKQSQTSTASTQPKPQSQPSASESVIEVGINQLLQEHNDNKIAAKRKYNGKKVRLSGFIIDIDEIDEENGKIYVILGEEKDSRRWNSVWCFFNDYEAESVIKLKEGQNITIEGTCKSYESGHIAQLQNSRVVSPNSSSTSQASERSSSQTSTQPTKTETEFERIQRLAQQGDANAQNKLGTMYEFGSGVAKDYNQAAEWYQKAAQQGLGLAQMNLAELYEKIEQNYAIAEYWYKEAANQGQAGAKTALERVQMKMGKEPTKTETAHTLQKPRNEEEAEENISIFIDSVKQVAEKLCTTPYKVQDVEFMPADEMREESENVYMRAWWYAENFFMFCNYNDNSWSKAYVATFRTNSPEFTFAGDIKVGSYFSKIRDLFGETAYWSSEEKTLLLADSKGNSATIHVSDGKVDYIEYSYYGDYTHKMLNLLYLYRDEIYSASITTESNSKLNVRREPDTQSDVLFQVLKNTNLLFIENSSGVIGNGGNEWYRVRFVYDDSAKTISSVNEAYVYGKYINIMPLTYGERESLINAFN